MGVIITPPMENTNNACKALVVQMARLDQVLGIVAQDNNAMNSGHPSNGLPLP